MDAAYTWALTVLLSAIKLMSHHEIAMLAQGYAGGLVDEIPYFLEFWRDHWVNGR